MVDWACVNGYGSDDDYLSYENEVPGCLKDACDTQEQSYYPEREITCKKCGSKMIKRQGKFGKFYGCVNFPECKGSRNI